MRRGSMARSVTSKLEEGSFPAFDFEGRDAPRTLADLNRMISAATPFVRGGPLALVGKQPDEQEDLQDHPFVKAALRDLRNASELAALVAKGEGGAAPISSKSGRSFFTTALGAFALRGDVRAVVEAILKRCDRVSIAVKKSNRRRLPGKPMELTAVLFVQL